MLMTEIWKTDSQQVYNALNHAKGIAETSAFISPCERRKYGAVLFDPITTVVWATAHNNRVSRCCDHGCIRDLMQIQHGHNTDLGAEVHAEQSLLVKYSYQNYATCSLLIVGFDSRNNPFYNKECWPCYSCARIIKEAGLRGVWVPLTEESFTFYPVDQILEEYEQELIGTLGDF